MSLVYDDILFSRLGKNFIEVINHLSNLTLEEFIFLNYSPNTHSEHECKYFINENADIIDGIRTQIEEWSLSSKVEKKEYILVIIVLVESVSLYSNIPGTYGAFNKKWDPRSVRKSQIFNGIVNNKFSKTNHKTYNTDLRHIIGDVECDVLYLDPPYTEDDYSMYYHVLETISLFYNPILNDNKTGTKKLYKKSEWCN